MAFVVMSSRYGLTMRMVIVFPSSLAVILAQWMASMVVFLSRL